jgi:RNA polymerase sigma-70 factor (ECF subfamily)
METDSLTGEGELVRMISKAAVNAESGTPAGAEETLIRAFLKHRKPRLFEELMSAHLPWLRRLLFAIFNGVPEDLEDAEQEILIGIFQDLERFRFQSGFKTFFYRYARNKAIDLLRKTVRRRRRESELEQSGIAGEARSPEDEYLRQERREDLDQLLLELAQDEREILLMKDVEEFSIDEIAAVTGQKAGTIKSKLHRTREKLFNKMEGRRLS